MLAPQSRLLSDGRRLHLQHGPIDLIIEVWGDNRDDAYAAATHRFQNILQELVDELPTLRSEARTNQAFDSPTARRMQAAVEPYAADTFVTPMAAVAGAVADEILSTMRTATNFEKAYVNNGGDTAFYLTTEQKIDALLFGPLGSRITVAGHTPCRGVATSGWQGRSHSLGIADTVTVAACNAASADVAATVIANSVDLPGHPEIERSPATEISPDSDLQQRPVTTGVGVLSQMDVATALDAGIKFAEIILARQLIAGALLTLRSESRIVGMKDQIVIQERNLLNE